METESKGLITFDVLDRFATGFFNYIPTLCNYHKVCLVGVLLYKRYILQKLIFSIFEFKSDSWNLQRLFMKKSTFLLLFVVRLVVTM